MTTCRTEMGVGIIAVSLPTLKPSVAIFFGPVNAPTYSERYGSRYRSRETSKARSRPPPQMGN